MGIVTKRKLEDLNGNEFLRAALIGSKEYGISGIVPRLKRLEIAAVAGIGAYLLTITIVLVHVSAGGVIPPWLESILKIVGVVIGA